MKRILLALSSLLLIPGCGPLMFPAIQRLSPDGQAKVDERWGNMLSPPTRLDREVLLDTIISYYLMQIGVDRLTMRSEKDHAGGRVVMDVRFDRARPAVDAFSIDLYDRDGRHVRSEKYTGAEVLAHVALLSEVPNAQATTRPLTPGELKDETDRARAAREAYERRMDRVHAATQPAQ